MKKLMLVIGILGLVGQTFAQGEVISGYEATNYVVTMISNSEACDSSYEESWELHYEDYEDGDEAFFKLVKPENMTYIDFGSSVGDEGYKDLIVDVGEDIGANDYITTAHPSITEVIKDEELIEMSIRFDDVNGNKCFVMVIFN